MQQAKPSWSKDGSQIVFLSRNEQQHRNWQVYLLNTLSQETKRLTYSDGLAANPIFINENKIVFTSTTDEEKERPALLYKNQSQFSLQPSELYLLDIDAKDNNRITQRLGFDGWPSAHPDEPFSLFYTSEENGKLVLNKLNLRTKSISKNLMDMTRKRSFTAFKNFWAWVELDPQSHTQQKVVIWNKKTNEKKSYEWGDSAIEDLSWINENELLLSSQFKDSPLMTPYILRIKEACLVVLLTEKYPIIHPAFHAGLNKLAYVKVISDKNQKIFYQTINPTELVCTKAVQISDLKSDSVDPQ